MTNIFASAPTCSIVYKAFLAQLTRCSKQPNYWVKPWLSLPRALRCILHPSQAPESFLSPPMSFTPLALPWLRLPSHCYITSATAPPLTRNPGHKQNWVLRKWRQWIWRSKTSHYSNRSFSAGVCPDSHHQTWREIAWAWLHLFLLNKEINWENRGGENREHSEPRVSECRQQSWERSAAEVL